jgi:hypothetical protein
MNLKSLDYNIKIMLKILFFFFVVYSGNINYIKEAHIENNFLFDEKYNKIDKNFTDNTIFYSDYIKLNIVAISIIYLPIIYYQLNFKNKNLKNLRNSYINNTHPFTSTFLVVYERVYYYYIIIMLSVYYGIRQYIFNKKEVFLHKLIKIILSISLLNIIIINHFKSYTNLTNNFFQTVDGKLVTFCVLYTNLMNL